MEAEGLALLSLCPSPWGLERKEGDPGREGSWEQPILHPVSDLCPQRGRHAWVREHCVAMEAAESWVGTVCSVASAYSLGSGFRTETEMGARSLFEVISALTDRKQHSIVPEESSTTALEKNSTAGPKRENHSPFSSPLTGPTSLPAHGSQTAWLQACAVKPPRSQKCLRDSGTGNMAQWLRALTALPEELGSVPSTHMVAHL